MERPMICACCFKDLECVEEDLPYQPYDANIFNSHGHYGSTLYDPVNIREVLSLSICSACMLKAAEHGAITKVTEVLRPSEYLRESWNPKID